MELDVGRGAVGSAYQKPPVSNRLEATGPFFRSRYCMPAHSVLCGLA